MGFFTWKLILVQINNINFTVCILHCTQNCRIWVGTFRTHEFIENVNNTCKCLFFIADIEAQIRDMQSRKKYLIEEMKEKERVALGETGSYDTDIYDGGGNKYDRYVTSIAANDEVDVSIQKLYFSLFYFQLYLISNLSINNCYKISLFDIIQKKMPEFVLMSASKYSSLELYFFVLPG